MKALVGADFMKLEIAQLNLPHERRPQNLHRHARLHARVGGARVRRTGIRERQERDYPERVHGTSFTNPDFAALARAYGAHGETVTGTAQFADALKRSVASGLPSVIEVVIDPNAITTQTTISALREKALKQRDWKAASFN